MCEYFENMRIPLGQSFSYNIRSQMTGISSMERKTYDDHGNILSIREEGLAFPWVVEGPVHPRILDPEEPIATQLPPGNPYKFIGKETVGGAGLVLYDFGARRLSGVMPRNGYGYSFVRLVTWIVGILPGVCSRNEFHGLAVRFVTRALGAQRRSEETQASSKEPGCPEILEE